MVENVVFTCHLKHMIEKISVDSFQCTNTMSYRCGFTCDNINYMRGESSVTTAHCHVFHSETAVNDPSALKCLLLGIGLVSTRVEEHLRLSTDLSDRWLLCLKSPAAGLAGNSPLI